MGDRAGAILRLAAVAAVMAMVGAGTAREEGYRRIDAYSPILNRYIG